MECFLDAEIESSGGSVELLALRRDGVVADLGVDGGGGSLGSRSSTFQRCGRYLRKQRI
ncbi:MAG: hypothetical protein WD895_05330 [Acidimicrobiia bacterium]